ncbi:nucleoporin Nup120/160-domain-containing protein [Dendryphion nanum]|uniref:Nucleoporin Nup120/160-domain-containing protein n=1 Tax=Dendryphion nanum TaxID=256645 RepID=A0A9P9E470_9PLEO|nr:nucleoporin Nup120/160-domain-containing protein [Dendryphion nanum]
MTMANTGGTCLYTEARLNLEPAFPGSTISITLPASTTSTFGQRTQSRRTVITEDYVGKDEDAFAKRHLATDGSLYFRRKDDYPRAFLWRLLDNRKTLELQSVDFDHDTRHNFEANLTILLHFSAPIRPFCIAFSEPEDRDILTIFAITTANELYSLNLHRDFFVNATASEQDVKDWCKRSTVTQFLLRVPYRLFAISYKELLVPLDNGGILHLQRDPTDDVVWSETIYQQNTWTGSVRGWLPWKGEQKIRFDNTDLEPSAAPAVALSPDRDHILSVCLNHRLRAWNIQSGKPGIQLDLLGESIRPNDKTQPYFIGPSQSTIMQVIDLPGGTDGAVYHVATYSPKKHQFKFWGIRDADDVNFGFYDVQPDVEFVPPVDDLMNTTVWTLEEFHFNPGPAGWRGGELWIRARTGPSSKVYSLKFDLYDDSTKLAQIWKDDWISVNSGPLTVEGLKSNPANPNEDDADALEVYNHGLPERWLDFLFYPGRFTTATLETALVILRRGLERTKTTQVTFKGSLKERLSVIVASLAASKRSSSDDLDDYEDALAAQWQAYYGLVKDLHKRRGEALSFAFDRGSEMPWLVLSDSLSAIRQSSQLETFTANASVLASPKSLSGPLRKAFPKSESRDVSRLLNAAAGFRKSLSSSFHRQLEHQVEIEILQTQSLSIFDRMELMEQNVDVLGRVSEEDISILVEDLGMNVRDLTSEIFYRAIQTLVQEEEGQVNKKRQIARFGLKALVRVSQESLDTNYNVLLDLLVLILFMQFEEDLSDDFEASEIFVEIINQLKDCLVLSWLAGNAWAHQSPTGHASETLMKTLLETFKSSRKLPFTQTLLEGIFGHQVCESAIPRGLKSELLTYWSRVWLTQLFKQQGYDASLDDIMGILLSQKEYDFASKFSKFLTDGTWGTYLKGRMHISLGENDLASICFQKSAYNLALGIFSVEDADQINFIPLDQRDNFSDGLPRFYNHVISLFEKVKAYSYVADFARLGIKSLKGTENVELKTELLSRLFNASVQTSRFDEAYTALTRHSDIALKRSALRTLTTSMVQQSQTAALLKFPFLGLWDEFDAVLTSLCHTALNLKSSPPYHQILYAFRISRSNFRGAATILYQRLHRLKSTSSQINDPADESLTRCYLMIINALSSVSSEDAYILFDPRIEEGSKAPQWGLGQAKDKLKRHIITLETLRKEYQAELDRVETIENGQYPYVEAGDEMDIL